ncbi:MAG TPA: DinB family protein [Candidatus Sulfomarinibacteraceae bacterium]|nr:DinB family protein [Candidatus Sulfomarinibacteraceae bacterium]
MPDSTLTYLFRHNLWANQHLLDVCAELDDEQLDTAVPGTRGSIRDTLVHLFAAEERYAAIFNDEQPQPHLSERNPFPGFDLLRQRAQASGQAFIDIAARDPHDEVLRGVFGDEPYAIPAPTVLLQVINHATEHRAHINTCLTQTGVTPPQLDAWHYEDG